MSNNRLHLFQGYGVELEYMIVDKESLAIRPITDELFKKVTGGYSNSVDKGKVSWCNELVLHVLELKCSRPEQDLVELAASFHTNVLEINQQLLSFNASLMPGAAHPLMDPEKDTFLWPHDNTEIYNAYNRIFNCRGHGWSNLQSTHLNLPFYDDEEFARLHAAIRLILPILPAIAASSPVMSGKDSGYLDKRLDYYQKNQRIIPSLSGSIIPERAFSKRQYHKKIYDHIMHDIAPYDLEKILKPVWLNSRGAIARFDRGSIEIRLLDIQECPNADMAIIVLIINVLKMLVNEKFLPYHDQQEWEVKPLHAILQDTIRFAENAEIKNEEYLKVFGVINNRGIRAGALWKHIIEKTQYHYSDALKPWLPQLNRIQEHGTLATRLLKSFGGIYTVANIKMICRELTDCLRENEMFEPCEEERS